jgi:DNA processing protein
MNENPRELEKDYWPEGLFEISQKPKQLYIRGSFPDKDEYKFLAIVGSRKHSEYAEQVIRHLVAGLAGKNVVIVSGLAIGVDAIAHREALKNNLKTIAVLGSGITDKAIHPKCNFRLAQEIMEKEGCLLSELEEIDVQHWSFPQRNRIMAAMSDAVLIVEAAEKSGTLITARLGLDYNKEVLTVPCSIFSNYGKGSNRLMKDGAHPVFGVEEVLEALKLDSRLEETDYRELNKVEKKILDSINRGVASFDEIILETNLETSELMQVLMEMEIKGFIKKALGEYESIL